jgi:CSLREA domain-containing protein
MSHENKPTSQSTFFSPRFLISFSSWAISGFLALVAFAAYPVENALAGRTQSPAHESGVAEASALEQAVDSSEALSVSTIPLATSAPEPDVVSATFVVNTTSDTLDVAPGDGACADGTGACSLRAAIGEANALPGDDIITLPAGTYTQTLAAANDDGNAGGDWDIVGNTTINGAGAGTTFIQANAAPGVATERVLDVRAGTVILNGVTIQNGRFTGTMTTATRGAGIQNVGTLTLNNCVVRDNRMNSTSGNPIGAGIHNAGPALTLTNTTVTANSNVRVSGGSAFGGGVSSIAATTITITDSSISGNSATSQSGGFGFGAGLYLENLFTVNATNSSFNNNTGAGTSGSNGSGVRALSNTGAAVFNATNCTFSGNSGTAGGNNQGQGLQLFTTSATAATNTATLNSVTVDSNSGGGPGLGIHCQANGGALNLSINNSTISNNRGATNGGGINTTNVGSALNSPVTVNCTNTTISGNGAANGGALYVEQPTAGLVTANLSYVTVANNTASAGGGGLFVSTAGTINLKSTIVADNTAPSGPDISGTITSQNYNHIENPMGGTFAAMPNDVIAGDPNLGALANNGGPTLTHFPGGGSPVINTIPSGTNECGTTVTRDQRGATFVRPHGGACDKGAVEIQALQPTNAVSRKTHGGAGDFDINLPLTGEPGVECRSSGGAHTLIFTFNNPVVSGNASVTTGTGAVTGTPTFSGNTMTVNLTGVADVQRITVTLSGVTDTFGQVLPSTPISVNMLVGDINASKVVNASDIGAVKAQSGVPVTAANFRADVAVSGGITASDIGLVKSRSGQSVP